MKEIIEITSCEVCNHGQLTSVLNLGNHPLCDDLIPLENSTNCDRYPIEILFCKTCITLHQRFQVNKQILFPKSYHYRSRFTQDVLAGMSSLVDNCEKKLISLCNKTVLDIGCNDGSLLNYFRNKGCKTIGVEPTSASLDAAKNNHIIYDTYFNSDIAKKILSHSGFPDIITFTNVFAHIEDLNELIRALKILMSPNTLLVIENHYLGAILDGNQFDTFYHEHPRTYSCTSFDYIAKLLDISLLDVEFPARYGGNIRVFLGGSSFANLQKNIDISQLKKQESFFFESFSELNNKIGFWLKKKKKLIQDYVAKNGPLYAKAFPGRSAILIILLGLDENLISAVCEKPGSLKIGHYVPGTRIPIITDDILFTPQINTKPLLNLAWHISGEIRTYMHDNGFKGPIIDIVSENDFFPDA